MTSSIHRPPPTNTWSAPWPYGAAESGQSVGLVAAPLLAGFSITLIATVEQSRVRWADLAQVLLVLATLSLVYSLQAAMWARSYFVKPSELEEWFPDFAPNSKDGDQQRLLREIQLRGQQRGYLKLHQLWLTRLRRAYNLGIVALLASLPVILIPPGQIPAGRWPSIVLAAGGLVAELTWITAATLRGPRKQGTPGLARNRILEWFVPSLNFVVPPDRAQFRSWAADLELKHVNGPRCDNCGGWPYHHPGCADSSTTDSTQGDGSVQKAPGRLRVFSARKS